jgi:type I restriction enzyme S subunit
LVTLVDTATSRIDALVAKSLGSITLLKERRAALITAAVTGNLDMEAA